MVGPVLVAKKSARVGVFTPIVRPRLIERIAFAAQQALTLIIAPAGYGKSVALRQYLASVGDQQILYNVRGENATLLGFTRGLADALIEVAAGARRSVSGAFEKAKASKTPGRDLAAWMHAHLEGYRGIIAIDDLHLAEQDAEITKFLTHLIDLAGNGTRWIIASRSPLDLPVASWLAYRQMNMPIDELDLRFDLSEARNACESLKTTVSDDELGEILALTEGWPTALSFALRLSMRLTDLRSIEAMTRAMTYRYLAEQVFYSLDEPTRGFLLYTSLMPSINVLLLARAGYDNAKAIIEELRHRVAFLYSESAHVYRYHELFREFLTYQLSILGNNAVVEMCARVGHAYESCGDIAQALRLYVQGGATELVLGLLERSAFDLIEQGHADVVEQATKSIAVEERSRNPAMLGIQASFEGNAGRLDRAERLYRRAISLTNDPSTKIRFAVRLATIMTNQSRAEAVSLLEPFSVATGVGPVERCEINSLLACACAVIGDTDRARERIHFALDSVEEIEIDELRARVYQRAGFVSFYCRDSKEATKYSTEAARLALTCGLYRLAASAYSVLYSTCFDYEHDTQAMLGYAEQVADCAIKAGDLQARLTALQQMLEIETQRGNKERISWLETQLAEPGMSEAFRFNKVVVPARALRATWEGNFGEAHRLLSSTLTRYEGSVEGSLRYAEYTLFLAVDGQREAAARALEHFATITVKPSSPIGSRQCEVARLFVALANALLHRYAMAAKVLRGTGTLDTALSALQRAVLTLCRSLEFAVDDSQLTDDLLTLESLGYGGYARTLGAVAQEITRQRPPSQTLTPSEIAILRALASGSTTKEIAMQTTRSVNTVHAHVRAVTRKLHCHGRQEAIAIARYAGLIP